MSFGGLTGGSSYTLVFGVFDRGDRVVDSGLLIDGVRSVPEPGSIAMLSLVGLSLLRVRRRSARVIFQDFNYRLSASGNWWCLKAASAALFIFYSAVRSYLEFKSGGLVGTLEPRHCIEQHMTSKSTAQLPADQPESYSSSRLIRRSDSQENLRVIGKALADH